MILCVCPNPSVDNYAWTSKFEVGDVNKITQIKEFPGGKGTHVAFALSELGAKVNLFGFWGGATGNTIKQACAEKNIMITGVDINSPNRKCYTFRSENKETNNTELLEPGPTITLLEWERFILEYEIQAEKANIISVSGSLPLGVPMDGYKILIDIASSLNKKIIVDCSGNNLDVALKAKPFGIHLNEDEALSLNLGKDIVEVGKILNKSLSLVAITKGKKGLSLFYNNQQIDANVNISKVINTVGSGDCLTAGLIYALSNNKSDEEIAKYGVACGAANCLNEDLGMLKRNDVKDLLPKTEIKILTHVS